VPSAWGLCLTMIKCPRALIVFHAFGLPSLWFFLRLNARSVLHRIGDIPHDFPRHAGAFHGPGARRTAAEGWFTMRHPEARARQPPACACTWLRNQRLAELAWLRSCHNW
jgi:hypothetical protein